MKIKELKELNIDELKKREESLRAELLKARIERSNHQIKNPLAIRHLKRGIAKVLTLINQKGAN